MKEPHTEPAPDHCQATPRLAFKTVRAASQDWECNRQASRKEGDDPRYCWQHQDKRKRY